MYIGQVQLQVQRDYGWCFFTFLTKYPAIWYSVFCAALSRTRFACSSIVSYEPVLSQTRHFFLICYCYCCCCYCCWYILACSNCSSCFLSSSCFSIIWFCFKGFYRGIRRSLFYNEMFLVIGYNKHSGLRSCVGKVSCFCVNCVWTYFFKVTDTLLRMYYRKQTFKTLLAWTFSSDHGGRPSLCLRLAPFPE